MHYSNLNLKKLIIHEIKKEQNTKEATVELEAHCLDSKDEKRKDLVEKLISAFRRSRDNIDIADFDSEARFSQILLDYLPENLENESTEDDFANFSRQATNLLADHIKEQVAAKGGYLIFTEYLLQQKMFVSIFLVRDADKNIFRKIHGVLDVDVTKVTDIEKLAMACRINLFEFINNSDSSLTMINTQNRDVSNYFATWLGSKNRVTSEKFTDIFIEAIKHMPLPRKLEGKKGEVLTQEEVEQKIFNMVDEDSEQSVRIDNISAHVWDDPDALSDFFEEKNIPLPHEFKASRKALKQLIEVNAKDGRLKLQFPKGDFRRKVKLSEEGNKVIIDSAEIYEEVKKHFNK